MTSLCKVTDGEMTEFKGRLSRAGLSAEMLRLINKRKNNSLAECMVLAVAERIGQTEINPFALSVEEQLSRLRQANEEEGWGIKERDIEALAKNAPEWPEGRLAFRSLRVRFGSGARGVHQTFEVHASRIKSVFEEKYRRWEYLRSQCMHLRLLSGNDTHKPAVEWVIFDLGAHRTRKSIEAVRGSSSLADEGLVFTWMFPEYIWAIDYKEDPAFFLAGYELNVPEGVDVPWCYVPVVGRLLLDTSKVNLSASWRSVDNSDYSVPFLQE